MLVGPSPRPVAAGAGAGSGSARLVLRQAPHARCAGGEPAGAARRVDGGFPSARPSARRDPEFAFHYVTAREMYNLVRAAEAGWSGRSSRHAIINWSGIPAPGDRLEACELITFPGRRSLRERNGPFVKVDPFAERTATMEQRVRLARLFLPRLLGAATSPVRPIKSSTRRCQRLWRSRWPPYPRVNEGMDVIRGLTARTRQRQGKRRLRGRVGRGEGPAAPALVLSAWISSVSSRTRSNSRRMRSD